MIFNSGRAEAGGATEIIVAEGADLKYPEMGENMNVFIIHASEGLLL